MDPEDEAALEMRQRMLTLSAKVSMSVPALIRRHTDKITQSSHKRCLSSAFRLLLLRAYPHPQANRFSMLAQAPAAKAKAKTRLNPCVPQSPCLVLVSCHAHSRHKCSKYMSVTKPSRQIARNTADVKISTKYSIGTRGPALQTMRVAMTMTASKSKRNLVFLGCDHDGSCQAQANK